MDEKLFDNVFKTRPYTTVEDSSSEQFAYRPGPTLHYSTLIDFQDDETGEAPPIDIKQAKTIPYISHDAERKKRTVTHNLGPGDKLELNSIEYEILEIITEEGKTGEAIIYKVKNKYGDIYVLKLYYEMDDEHLEPSPDTLQRIREISGGDILHLFDFGTGPNKYRNKYCFEICDFAKGGDLLDVEDLKKKYTPEFLEKVVISSIFRGIKTLHKEKIFHCDLKPQNVFFLDEEQTELVIGDYGSAKSFDKTSEKELTYTTITKGTEFYIAPEQAFGIVSEKNDFYSLGMIVMHLLYPEKVTRKNLRKIFERRTKGIQIIDFDKKFERLNQFIEGLTLQDYTSRWGGEEISNWLAGFDVSVNYATKGIRNYIKIGESIIRTGKDLANYIEAGNSFYEELIEDKEGYSVLLTWINFLQGEESRKSFDKMVSYYKKYYGIDYVRESLLFYFNPTRKISIGLKTSDFSNEFLIQAATRNFVEHLDDLWKFTDFPTIRFYFFQFEFALRQLRTKSREINIAIIDEIFIQIAGFLGVDFNEDFSDYRAEFFINLKNGHLIDIFYAFNPDRAFRGIKMKEYKSLFEVQKYFENHPRLYDDKFMQLERRGFLKKTTIYQFIDFFEKCDNCIDFLMKDQDDFNFFVDIIFHFVSNKYSKTFIENILNYYKPYDAEILIEVVLRLLQDDRPVIVDDKKINFFRKEKFIDKIREFFKHLDLVWKKEPFEKITKSFFQFEFVLLQISSEDKIAQKAIIKPVFDKIGQILHRSPGNVGTLEAKFFNNLDDENIIDLFYLFNPQRGFCDESTTPLDTILEIGFYFVRNPDLFNEKYNIIERNAFLKYRNLKSYSNLGYDDFILKIFQYYRSIETDVKDVFFDEPSINEVTIVYDYIQSLTNYFSKNGINKKFEIKSNKPKTIVIKKGHIVVNETLFDRFTSAVVRNHNISGVKLSGKSKDSFFATLEEKTHLEFIKSFTYIPMYLIYLFPIFGLLYFCVNYLVDYSVFKDIAYSLSPTLSMVSVRLAKSYYSTILLSAYTINFLTGVFLMVPVLSLPRKNDAFVNFFEYNGSLINRLILAFLFAPVLFIAFYALASQSFEQIYIFGKKAGVVISLESLTIYLYIIFMMRQLLKIIVAFFKSYKKFRILPLLIAVAIYLIIGYFTIAYQNITFSSREKTPVENTSMIPDGKPVEIDNIWGY